MRHVSSLICLVLLNTLVLRAASQYGDEDDEELEADDNVNIDNQGLDNDKRLRYGYREKKRAWTSGFTGGFGKRASTSLVTDGPEMPALQEEVPDEELVEEIPFTWFGKRQWNHQGVRGMWGKRGQRVRQIPWIKSKQHQGVRGSWGKRGALNSMGTWGKRGALSSMGTWGKRGSLNSMGSWLKRGALNSMGSWGKRDSRELSEMMKFHTFGGTIYPSWREVGKRGLNTKHIVKLVNKGSNQKLRGMWGKRESENPVQKASSSRYYLVSSFPWATKYAPNGAIKSLMKVAGNKRAQSWLQLRGMWGKRSKRAGRDDSRLSATEELDDDIDDTNNIDGTEPGYEIDAKPMHQTYRMNPDFGKVRMIPRLE